MMTTNIFILLLVVVVFVVITVLWQRRRSGGGEKKKIGNIGNKLAVYFFRMGLAWSKNETFVWNGEDAETDFFKHLPRSVPPPPSDEIIIPDPEYKELHVTGVWRINTHRLKMFWDSMKPYVHKYTHEALVKSNFFEKRKEELLPVIHFRCSDFPFDRCSEAHFQKYSFFKNVLKSRNIHKVKLITCNRWNSDRAKEDACKTYFDLLVDELSPYAKIYPVFCRDVLEDFAEMFYAPLVISTGSSMSFMAGYFGNGQLITGGHVDESYPNDECLICDGSYDLFHRDVENYYDTEKVHQQLLG